MAGAGIASGSRGAAEPGLPGSESQDAVPRSDQPASQMLFDISLAAFLGGSL